MEYEFCYFARIGDVASCSRMIRDGIDVNYNKGLGDTPLHCAAYDPQARCIPLLLDAGADPDVKGHGDRSPLHIAAMCDNVEVIKILLGNGININAQDTEGRTALHYAAQGGHENTTQILLDNGIDISITENQDNLSAKGYALKHRKKYIHALISNFGHKNIKRACCNHR